MNYNTLKTQICKNKFIIGIYYSIDGLEAYLNALSMLNAP